jgi:subtilisin-like proprotein convertase family protein
VTRRAGGGLASLTDVNGDGRADLVVDVPRKLLRLDADSREAVLTGFTAQGRPIWGSDPIAVADTATMVFDSDEVTGGPEPSAVDFTNNLGITINDVSPATPYPSTINVLGLPGVISKVRVTLRGLSHTFPNDIDVLLVGPTGQNLVLMSDVGGSGAVANVALTFDDDAASRLDPAVLATTGTYRPINFTAEDPFPAPAPASTAATALSAFTGTNPNGTWSLYVVDDQVGDVGTIAGWSIDFVLASEFCTGGSLTINDNAPGAPYPATIAVAGLSGIVSKVTASLRGLTHTFPDDIDLLVVGPTGLASMVLSDTGGTGPGVAGVSLVLDDNAPLTLDPGTNPASGTYQPGDGIPGESLPAPAPAGPYPLGFRAYGGTNPNGAVERVRRRRRGRGRGIHRPPLPRHHHHDPHRRQQPDGDHDPCRCARGHPGPSGPLSVHHQRDRRDRDAPEGDGVAPPREPHLPAGPRHPAHRPLGRQRAPDVGRRRVQSRASRGPRTRSTTTPPSPCRWRPILRRAPTGRRTTTPEGRMCCPGPRPPDPTAPPSAVSPASAPTGAGACSCSTTRGATWGASPPAGR